MKEKEKELERVEEQGCALVQNKTDEACAIVMETLQVVNHSWANLDHLVTTVIWLFFYLPLVCSGLTFSFHRVASSSTDRTTKDQPDIGAGSVESVQTSHRGNQCLPDGGKILSVTFPPPDRLPGGRSAASAKSAGIFVTSTVWHLVLICSC